MSVGTQLQVTDVDDTRIWGAKIRIVHGDMRSDAFALDLYTDAVGTGALVSTLIDPRIVQDLTGDGRVTEVDGVLAYNIKYAAGNKFSYGGIVLGAARYDSEGQYLELSFGYQQGEAGYVTHSLEDYNRLFASLRLGTASLGVTRQVQFLVTDAAHTVSEVPTQGISLDSVWFTREIQFQSSDNTAPQLSLAANEQVWQEGWDPLSVGRHVTAVIDLDQSDMAQGHMLVHDDGVSSVRVTVGHALPDDRLRWDASTLQGAFVDMAFDPSAQQWTLTLQNPSLPKANVLAWLQSITWQHDGRDPTAQGMHESRTVQVAWTDGRDNSTAAQNTTGVAEWTFAVQAVNQVPVVSRTPPQVDRAVENVRHDLGQWLQLSDEDVADDTVMTLTLAVPDTGGHALDVQLAETGVVQEISSTPHVLRLSGTLQQLQNLLDQGGITYTAHAQAPAPSVTVQVTLHDGIDSSEPMTWDLPIESVNDEPTVVVGQTVQIDEDQSWFITGISVEDVDSPHLEVTLRVDHGRIEWRASNAMTGVTVNGQDTSMLTLSGEPSMVNAWLAEAQQAHALVYQPDANAENDDELTVAVSDGQAPRVVGTLRLDIQPINDVPQAQPDFYTAYVGVAEPGNLLTNDADVETATARLRVTAIAQADDSSTTVEVGADLDVPTTLYGLYGRLQVSADGVYGYDVSSTSSAVLAMQGYEDILTESFTYTIEDTEGGQTTATLQVTLHGSNDGPVVQYSVDSPDATQWVQSVTEGAAVRLLPEVLLSDVDSQSLREIRLTMNAVDIGQERLYLAHTQVTITVDGQQQTVFFSSYLETDDAGRENLVIRPAQGRSAPIEAFEAVLREVHYQNSSDDPSDALGMSGNSHSALRTVLFTIEDDGDAGGGDLADVTGVVYLTVLPVNDAPVISLDEPSANIGLEWGVEVDVTDLAPVLSTLKISDADDARLSQAVVRVHGWDHATDELAWAVQAPSGTDDFTTVMWSTDAISNANALIELQMLVEGKVSQGGIVLLNANLDGDDLVLRFGVPEGQAQASVDDYTRFLQSWRMGTQSQADRGLSIALKDGNASGAGNGLQSALVELFFPAQYTANAAPVITLQSANANWTEGSPALVLGEKIKQMTDADSTLPESDEVQRVVITMTNALASDVLTLPVPVGFRQSVSAVFLPDTIQPEGATQEVGVWQIEVTGIQSLELTTQTLQSLKFENTSADPDLQGQRVTRTITMDVYDAYDNFSSNEQEVGTASWTFSVQAVNQTPVLKLNQPDAGARAVEGVPYEGLGEWVTLDDADIAPDAWMTLTVKVPSGPAHSLEGSSGTDDVEVLLATAEQLQVRGTLTALRDWLSGTGLQYTAMADHPDASVAIEFTLDDGSGTPTATTTSSLRLPIDPINDAPSVAADTPEQGAEDSWWALQPVEIIDPDSAHLSVVLTVGHGRLLIEPHPLNAVVVTGQGSSHVTLSGSTEDVQVLLQTAQAIRYQPGAEYSGNDVLTVTATDDQAASVQHLRPLIVKAVNDIPVAVDDRIDLSTTADHAMSVSGQGSLLGNDTDVETLPQDLTVIAAETSNSVWRNVSDMGLSWPGQWGDFTLSADGQWQYTLDTAHAQVLALAHYGQTLQDSFRYRISDGSDSAQASATVVIHGVNDAPVAQPDILRVSEQGGLNNLGTSGPWLGEVLGNDQDPDREDVLAVTSVQSLNAVTAAPLPVSAATNRHTGTSVVGEWGLLVVGADGTYSYQVNLNNARVQALRTSAQTLTDVFSYTVTDTGGLTQASTITITVQGSNDAPMAVADAALAKEAAGLANAIPGLNPSGNVLLNDTDADSVDQGEFLRLSAVAQGSQQMSIAEGASVELNGRYGQLTMSSNGRYTYVVNNSLPDVERLRDVTTTLQDVFTYTLRDAAGLESVANLTVTVVGGNDTPTLSVPADFTMLEDKTLVFKGLVLNDIDAGSELAVVQLSASNGTIKVYPVSGVTVTANQTANLSLTGTLANLKRTIEDYLEYRPNGNYFGPDAITVTFKDGTSTVNGAFKIDITSVNDSPWIYAGPLYYNGLAPNFIEADAIGLVASGTAIWSGVSGNFGGDPFEKNQKYIGMKLRVDGLQDGPLETLAIMGTNVAMKTGTVNLGNGVTAEVQVSGSTAEIKFSRPTGWTLSELSGLVGGFRYLNLNADNPSAGYRTFTLTQIQDSGGTANSGTDTTPLNHANSVKVIPVNDRPVSSAPLTFYTDDNQPVTRTVRNWFGSVFSDADTGDRFGGVVLQWDQGGNAGVYEYSTNGGVSWTTRPTSLLTNGLSSNLYLAPDSLLRYTPSVSGVPGALIYRMVDSYAASRFTSGNLYDVQTLDLNLNGEGGVSRSTATLQPLINAMLPSVDVSTSVTSMASSGQIVRWTLDFNEAVTGLDASDVVVLNGTRVGDMIKVSDSLYHLDIQMPSTGSGVTGWQIQGDKLQDKAGTGNALLSGTLRYGTSAYLMPYSNNFDGADPLIGGTWQGTNAITVRNMSMSDLDNELVLYLGAGTAGGMILSPLTMASNERYSALSIDYRIDLDGMGVGTSFNFGAVNSMVDHQTGILDRYAYGTSTGLSVRYWSDRLELVWNNLVVASTPVAPGAFSVRVPDQVHIGVTATGEATLTLRSDGANAPVDLTAYLEGWGTTNNKGWQFFYGGSSGTTQGMAWIDDVRIDTENQLTGSLAADVLLGGDGADVLVGNGGADTLLAGKGNDRLVLKASNVTELSGTSATVGYSGGEGVDTLQLSDTQAVTLDLTLAATNRRLSGIEIYDVRSATVGHTIKLNLSDVLASDLSVAGKEHVLVVQGSAKSVLQLDDLVDKGFDAGNWVASPQVTYNGVLYNSYVHTMDSRAMLLTSTELIQVQLI